MNITIVMYHYVRNLQHSLYPEIKGLDTEEFKRQVEYIGHHYNVISAADLMNHLTDAAPLPPMPLLLTFDDGYIDHYTDVFPVLEQAGMPGCFFVPAGCIEKHGVLDVNKIHFILAAVENKALLVDSINRKVTSHQSREDVKSVSDYEKDLAHPSRYDPAEILYIKRMLQRGLPGDLRASLTAELFHQFVTSDEKAFARELYLSPEQIRHMNGRNMYFGNHGYNHQWLNHLSKERQAEEIDMAQLFLRNLGCHEDRWMMCYPHGGYSEEVEAVIHDRGCVAAITTEVALANSQRDRPLALPRINTNDLPPKNTAQPNPWTEQAKAWGA